MLQFFLGKLSEGLSNLFAFVFSSYLRVEVVGCFLPLSEQTDIRKSFGTRHRAALGLAEETDAVVLVVSEETGAISIAYDANLLYDLTLEELSHRLKSIFEYSVEEEPVLED